MIMKHLRHDEITVNFLILQAAGTGHAPEHESPAESTLRLHRAAASPGPKESDVSAMVLIADF